MNLSANGNNGTSQYILAMLYFEGKYCKKDINKSIQYLISSANNDYPFGVGSCMDFRRLLPRERVDRSFGSAYTDFFLTIEKVNPKMTIKEICSLFRNKFNKIKNTDFFYNEYLYPNQVLIENCPISHVSNVGPMKIKSPLKDFYIQCSSNEFGLRPFLQITMKNNEMI